MNIFIRIVCVFVSVIFLVGFFGFVMPSLIGFLITVLLIIAIWDIFARRYRQATRTFNSAAEAVAHQQGAISKVALAFAGRGPLGGPCFEYSRRLTAGQDPIDAAVQSRVPLHLTTAVAMVSAGQNAGFGNQAKPEAGGTSNAKQFQHQPLPSDDIVLPAYAHIMYVIITAMVTCIVLGFISVFIVPTMEKMMEEFGLQRPNEWLRIGSTPTQALLTFVIVTLLGLTPILTTGSLFGIPVPRWMPVSPQVVGDKSNTLRGLADAIESGMTVDQALALAAKISLKPSHRRSLLHANSLIRQGVAPAEALKQSGWLSVREGDWLRGATAPRGAELLRWIADQRVRDAHANLRWVIGTVFPALVVLLGMAVLAYSVGFFGTLVSLISGLS
ncbi:MAG: type II secretion system F family protein [Pirellulaceae bacterium]